jgi:hypothetical protein
MTSVDCHGTQSLAVIWRVQSTLTEAFHDMVASPKCLSTVAWLHLATMPFWAQNTDSHLAKVCPPSQKISYVLLEH